MMVARVTKRFAEGPTRSPFTLEIEIESAASITVLYGPAESGKSLILNAIAGFLRPDAGRILVGDALVFDAAAGVHLPPQARRAAYVPPDYGLFPHMTLRENLGFAAAFRPKLDRHRKVSEMLELFQIQDVAGRQPHEVSQRQRLRAAIARALIAQVRLLLLDEPGGGLDAQLRADLQQALHAVRTHFATPVVIATRDLETAFACGERMYVLEGGRILQQGAPSEIFKRPASVAVARLLGACNLLPAEVLALDPGRNTSSLRWATHTLCGPYLPGKFRGDRVWLCARPDELRAFVRNGPLRRNQIPVALEGAIPRPGAMRLKFTPELEADVSPQDFDRHKHNKEWVVEFPEATLRVL